MRETTSIFGYNFICDTSYEQLAADLVNDVASEAPFLTGFVTPNAHGINSYLKYPDLNAYCQSCRYVLPDGQPIVWLSKCTAHPIKERLTGSDFFPVLLNKIKPATFKCLFVVSSNLVKNKFISEKPDASYLVPEFFTMDDHEKIDRISNQMADEIINNNINYVFIGISEPKQGRLGQQVTEKLKARGYTRSCIFFFLVLLMNFISGLKKELRSFIAATGSNGFIGLGWNLEECLKDMWLATSYLYYVALTGS